ncbi:hypothetical protein GCM10022235_00280 [Kribbella ginsengisoli]|uniref:Uncharacterized protein n=2 Tax=Kribbella ginsengisoli TaxID=363865 RepID=A0ABP6VN34_9ACTN
MTRQGPSDEATVRRGLTAAQEAFASYIASAGTEPMDLPPVIAGFRGLLDAGPVVPASVRIAVTANLLVCLRLSFVETDAAVLLEEGLQRGRQALGEMPTEASVPVAFWSALAGIHSARSALSGLQEDMDLSLDCLRKAVASAEDRFKIQANLASNLRHVYERTGDPKYLAEAAVQAREAHQGAPEMFRVKTAYMLSTVLSGRYEAVGETADLTEALQLARWVVDEEPALHPERPGHLAHLASLEHDLYERTGDPTVRASCIGHYEMCLAVLDQIPSVRPVIIANWAAAIIAVAGDRVTPGQLVRVDRSVPAAEQDLGLLKRVLSELTLVTDQADGTAMWAWSAIGLARAYLARYGATGAASDLEESIRRADTVLERQPDDDADRAEYWIVAAQALLARWSESGAAADLARAGRLLNSAVDHVTARPLSRIEAARLLAAAAIEDERPVLALSACDRGVGLLPVLAWPGVSRRDREFRLVAVSDVCQTAMAMGLYAGKPEQALELSDAGRAVIWAGILNRRRDLSAVSAVAPALAERLWEVRTELVG